MNQRFTMVLPQPPERLHRALCERSHELAPLLPHIDAILPIRSETLRGGRQRRVHAWRARADLPGLLAQHIDEGLLAWTCTTEWRSGDCASRWIVVPRAMKDAALCEAALRLAPALGARGTRADIELVLCASLRGAGWSTLACAILAMHFRRLLDAAGGLAAASADHELPRAALSAPAA